MQTNLNPHASFTGNVREAMALYQSVFGGTLDLCEYSEYGGSNDPSEAQKIKHAQLEADGAAFMAAQQPAALPYSAPAGKATDA